MAIQSKIIKKLTVAEGTLAVQIEKPAGFNYRAGQYIDVSLIDPPETDAEGNTRTFSIASAPCEPYLMVATRLRDTAFKRTLQNLPDGSAIKIDGPFGSFTLQNNAERPAVFLIGGIGITPVRSIVLQASHDMLPHKIFLFYSNRRPEDAAFLYDLRAAAEKNSNFTLVATMTETEKSKQSWKGETGYLSKEMISRYLNGTVSRPIYYVAGPPAMAAAMQSILKEMSVNEDDILIEEFAGY